MVFDGTNLVSYNELTRLHDVVATADGTLVESVVLDFGNSNMVVVDGHLIGFSNLTKSFVVYDVADYSIAPTVYPADLPNNPMLAVDPTDTAERLYATDQLNNEVASFDVDNLIGDVLTVVAAYPVNFKIR